MQNSIQVNIYTSCNTEKKPLIILTELRIPLQLNCYSISKRQKYNVIKLLTK